MVPTSPPNPVDPDARVNYAGVGLEQLDDQASPLTVLQSWYQDAVDDPRVGEPAAMVLATVDSQGMPNARTVLLKGLSARGFVFYTNTESTKAVELSERPAAALVLPWHPMYRQVRARGQVEPLDRAQSEAYFQSRPRESQIAAWASRQSQELIARPALQHEIDRVSERFEGADVLPLPPFWGGYLVRPIEVELWVGRASRVHDRWVWASRTGAPASLAEPAGWRGARLQP